MRKMIFLCLISSALHAAGNEASGLVVDYYPQNMHVLTQDTLDTLANVDIQQSGDCSSCSDFNASCSKQCLALCPKTEREAASCAGGLICGAFSTILCLFGI